MGVNVRKFKGTWYVFIDFNGRRKAKKIGTRQAAEEVRREIEARLALGDLSCLDKAPPVPTFEAYAERWVQTDALATCKLSTIDFYRDYQKRYILPKFGQMQLTAITRDAIKGVIAELGARGLARNIIRLAIASLRVLSAAVEDAIITSNPATKVGQFVETESPNAARWLWNPRRSNPSLRLLANIVQSTTRYF